MTKQPRGTCQFCGKEWALTSTGVVRLHNEPGSKVKCVGSEFPPEEAKIAPISTPLSKQVACEDCTYFHAPVSACHRYPPPLGRNWPRVFETDFCGEFKERG